MAHALYRKQTDMLTINICPQCGAEFEWDKRGRSIRKFCSMRCRGLSQRTTLETFWTRVEKTDGCWIWKGATSHNGYGVLTMGGKQHKAHRIAYDLTHDVPLGELFACHTCDNPRCVRPDHIFAGTTYDNMQDMIRKGRSKYHLGGALKQRIGERNGRARLTEEQVLVIRQKHATGKYSISELAREYNISNRQIGRVIEGESWAYRRTGAAYDSREPQWHMHCMRASQ